MGISLFLLYLHFIVVVVKSEYGYTFDVEYLGFVNNTSEEIFLDNGESYGPIEIGFDMNFFGTLYPSFWVQSNGFLSFIENEISAGGNCGNAVNESVMVMLTQLKPNKADPLQLQTYQNCPIHKNQLCTIAQFSHYHYPSGVSAGTWEIILYYDGDIILNYLDAGGLGGGLLAVTGLRSWEETVLYKCGESIDESGPSVVFINPLPGSLLYILLITYNLPIGNVKFSISSTSLSGNNTVIITGNNFGRFSSLLTVYLGEFECTNATITQPFTELTCIVQPYATGIGLVQLIYKNTTWVSNVTYGYSRKNIIFSQNLTNKKRL